MSRVHPERPPPNVSRAVQKLIRDVAGSIDALSHVDASRVLVVLGEARRASRASVRPLHFAETASRRSVTENLLRPRVRFRGRNMYYVLTLRPLFFLESTARERIATIIHEIFHFSERFDGTLHPARRHSVMGEAFSDELRPLVDRYLDIAPRSIWESMSAEGMVRVRMWLEKPGLTCIRVAADGRRFVQGRQIYTEEQTFLTLFPMRTARPREDSGAPE